MASCAMKASQLMTPLSLPHPHPNICSELRDATMSVDTWAPMLSQVYSRARE